MAGVASSDDVAEVELVVLCISLTLILSHSLYVTDICF